MIYYYIRILHFFEIGLCILYSVLYFFQSKFENYATVTNYRFEHCFYHLQLTKITMSNSSDVKVWTLFADEIYKNCLLKKTFEAFST